MKIATIMLALILSNNLAVEDNLDKELRTPPSNIESEYKIVPASYIGETDRGSIIILQPKDTIICGCIFSILFPHKVSCACRELNEKPKP